jgi:hypothetical protein
VSCFYTRTENDKGEMRLYIVRATATVSHSFIYSKKKKHTQTRVYQVPILRKRTKTEPTRTVSHSPGVLRKSRCW